MQAGSGSSDRTAPEPDHKHGLGQFLKELPVLIVVALGIAILVKTYVVQAFFIPSESMEDTLQVNDRVLVSKFAYRLGDPQYSDLVVFTSPLQRGAPEVQQGPVGRFVDGIAEGLGFKSSEQDFIKRVIATEGQTVQIKGGSLYVDDEPLDEPYLKDGQGMGDFGPTDPVPQDQIFVMGDNRSNSEDSRKFGPIPESSVLGRAFVRIWPLGRIEWLGAN